MDYTTPMHTNIEISGVPAYLRWDVVTKENETDRKGGIYIPNNNVSKRLLQVYNLQKRVRWWVHENLKWPYERLILEPVSIGNGACFIFTLVQNLRLVIKPDNNIFVSGATLSRITNELFEVVYDCVYNMADGSIYWNGIIFWLPGDIFRDVNPEASAVLICTDDKPGKSVTDYALPALQVGRRTFRAVEYKGGGGSYL